jgi:HD-GYP domain-containing protein (c-di-GMP phosphodiesterase class II)
VLASAFLKDFRFPFDVLRIIRHHHERWDGTGYPDGLKGEEIPIGSRIISIIEAFEVMSSGRGYKPPRGSREILEELRRVASTQFDPSLVSDFIDYLASKIARVE